MRFKPLWIPLLFAVLASSLLVGLGSQRQEAASSKTPVTARPSLAVNYGKLPLSFEVNQGQTDARVKFLSRGSGYALFLASTEAVLAFRGVSERSVPALGDANTQTNAGWKQELSALSFRPALITKGPQTHAARSQPGAMLRMELVGAKPAAKVEGLDELPGKSNYFIGSDPQKWRTNVPNYGRVKVHDVYPGVDLMYYGNKRQLEEDFVVAPGADPRAITMEVAGAEKVSIDAQGDLVLTSPGGEVHLRKPVVYQRAGDVQHEIAGGYELKGENRVGLELGEYDVTQPLVIDPVLAYSTFLGGSGFSNEGDGIAVDSAGNAYVTGLTGLTNFPTTPGAFQTTLGGGADAFVTKLNAAGSALLYSTYLGGSGSDRGLGVAVDSAGNAYVTGNTQSPDFPITPGAFQTAFGGSADAFVTKLNAAGSALLYSTYLGGSGGAGGNAIAVDSAGNAYVTGGAGINFPTTPGAFQTTLGGGGDAFVTKLNADGSTLVYSTYLGGSGGAVGNAIAVDSAGNAYVTGIAGINFPTTPGAFQAALPGRRSTFVAKLNAAGSALVYSTYLGGSGDDFGQGIAVDSSGNAYVTGNALSTDFPITPGAFQTATGNLANPFSAFVTKLNVAGSALVYSTYLGGSGRDRGFGVAVDSSGNAYVTGWTESSDFPISPGTIQNTRGSILDGFVTKVNAAGSALVYSTYLGGNQDDKSLGIAVDSAGSTYVTGFTLSPDFPITPGAFQTLGGCGLPCSQDAFVTKIADANTPAGTNVAVQPTDTATGTAPASLTFSTITQAGFTNLTTSSSGSTPPAGFDLGSPAVYYSLTTTATFTGSITVCINYTGITFTSGPQLFHFEGGNWVDVTTSVDTVNQIVCGSVTSLSPFALFQPTISGLMGLVNSFNLPHGTANSLLAKLSNAQASFASGNLTAACNQLNAFINEVEAQSGKKITATQANQLIVAANGVKVGLGCQ